MAGARNQAKSPPVGEVLLLHSTTANGHTTFRVEESVEKFVHCYHVDQGHYCLVYIVIAIN